MASPGHPPIQNPEVSVPRILDKESHLTLDVPWASTSQRYSYPEACVLLHQWIRNAQKWGMGQLIKVANMFDTHLQGIVHAMVHSKSNTMAEQLKRNGRATKW